MTIDSISRRNTPTKPPFPFDDLPRHLLGGIGQQIGFVATARTEIKPSWISEVIVAPAVVAGHWHIGIAGTSLDNKLVSPRPIPDDKVTDQLRGFGLESATFRVRRAMPTAANPCLAWGTIRQARRRPNKDYSASTVYFVQADTGGPIKIGIADNVSRRLNNLQAGNPAVLKVLGIIPDGGRKAESALHRRFGDFRIRGEWFEPTPELVEHIEQAAVPYDSAVRTPTP